MRRRIGGEIVFASHAYLLSTCRARRALGHDRHGLRRQRRRQEQSAGRGWRGGWFRSVRAVLARRLRHAVSGVATPDIHLRRQPGAVLDGERKRRQWRPHDEADSKPRQHDRPLLRRRDALDEDVMYGKVSARMRFASGSGVVVRPGSVLHTVRPTATGTRSTSSTWATRRRPRNSMRRCSWARRPRVARHRSARRRIPRS